MKTKCCRVLMITVAALLALTGSPLRAQPDKMILDNSKVSGEKTRPAVTLPHNKHVEGGLSCKDCHHIYENGKNILDESKLEEGNQGIRCSAAMVQSSDSIWRRLFTTSAWVAIRGPRKKRKRRAPAFVGNVM
jgi:hypothetical protein